MLSPLHNLALQDDVRIKVQSNTRQYGHLGGHTKVSVLSGLDVCTCTV